jgi:hypothetical protein
MVTPTLPHSLHFRSRNLEAKEGMKLADRQREYEKNMYQMDLYSKVDQKVEDLAKREIEIEREKVNAYSKVC